MGNFVKHVAIIMDGNRRWAKYNNCSYEESYKKATVAIKNVIKEAILLKIPYLTLFAFSTDNNKRNFEEIHLLKKLIETYINTEADELLQNNIKLNFIGDYHSFDRNLALKLDNLQKHSANNNGLDLTIALNYSGKKDLLQAINKIIQNRYLTNKLFAIDQEELESNLLTSRLPDPDILIRTGGNKRISNFFLWQISYTELFFSNVLWPDFTKEHFTKIIECFKNIERKYGK